VSSAGGPLGTGGAVALERDRELAEIAAVLADARASRGGCAVIEGAAGLGKTLLLSLASRRAQEDGMTVLHARAGALARQVPLGVALQLFEPYLSAAEPGERRRVFAGAAAHAERLLSDGTRPPGVGGSPESALLHSLHWVAVNISERRPLLVAVDDAHAADEASLRALLYTAQRIEDLPLALVIAARPRPASASVGDALGALAGQPQARRLQLGALSEQAIAAIVRSRLPEAEDPFCAACARATGGNPFFARELLAELAAAGVAPTADQAERAGEMGPSTVARAIGGRLERCSPGATPLARAAAVLGDGARLADAAALAGLAEEDARPVAAELAEIDVLRAGGELAFAHPIVGQAVYLGIPEGERTRLHLAAARLLETRRASGKERAATHLLQVAPSGEAWIAACLQEGAERALAGGSAETAVHYLARALDEPPPPERRAALLIDLGRAEALAGRPTATERVRGALALLERPVERARALGQLGQALYTAGDNAGAASAFDEGLRLLEGADPVLAEELTAGYLSAARLDFRTREAAQTRFKDLLGGAEDATTPVQRELLAQRALEHAMQGDLPLPEVVAMIRRARSGEDLLREVTADGVAYAGGAAALLFCDALEDAEAMAGAGLEDARRRSSVIGFAVMSAVRGAARYLRGDVVGGLGDLQGGLERVDLMVLVRPFAQGWLALAHLDRGELEQARQIVEQPTEEQDQYFTYNWSLFARGRLRRIAGDPVRALEDLRECGRRQLAVPAPSPAVLPWRSPRTRSGTSARRASWRPRSCGSPARSTRRGRSARRCGRPASSPAARTGSSCSSRRSTCSTARPRGWSGRGRSSTSAPPSARRAPRRPRARRCARRSTRPTTTAPRRSPRRRAAS